MGTSKRERQKANRQQRLEELAKAARRNKSRRIGVTVAIVVVAGLVLLFGLAWIVGDDDEDAATTTLPPVTVPPVTTVDPLATTTTTDPNATTTTEGPTTTTSVPYAYGTAPCPAADGSSEEPETFEGAPQKCIDETKGYVAEIVTDKGTFEITLDAKKSPGNVNNFVTLARYGYYTDTTCHRIIKDFVVQCGRDESESEAKPGYTVNDELPGPDEYMEGIVAIANTGSPNSGSAQFFIIVGDDGATLPPQYTIIGRVTKGYESTVAALENLADPLADNGVPPLVPVTIESVTITELDEPPATTVPTTTSTTTTTIAPVGDTTDDTADIPTTTT